MSLNENQRCRMVSTAFHYIGLFPVKKKSAQGLPFWNKFSLVFRSPYTKCWEITWNLERTASTTYQFLLSNTPTAITGCTLVWAIEHIVDINSNLNTRQAKNVKRKIESPLCNHCRSEKAITIIYSGCVFIALIIQHAMRMRHIFVCGQPGSTIFFHIITLSHDFRKKENKLLNVKRVFGFSL